MNQQVPSPFGIFNTVKVVFFKEVAPLTDKFEQIMLTPEQIKVVMRALSSVMPKTPPEKCEHCKRIHDGIVVTTDDDNPQTFPNIKTVFTQAEIDEAK